MIVRNSGALFLAVMASVSGISAQQDPAEDCWKLWNVPHMVLPLPPEAAGTAGVIPWVPPWSGLDVGLPERGTAETDPAGHLLVELDTPGPILQGLGRTAQKYLRNLTLTSNPTLRVFPGVAGGDPEFPGTQGNPYPGNGGGFWGPFLGAAFKKSCEPIEFPNAHGNCPSTAPCICTATTVDLGTPPTPTNVCDCGAPTGPRRDGVMGPVFQQWHPSGTTGVPYVGVWGRPGDSANTYQYFDWNGTALNRRLYYDVRHVDGTVVRFEQYYQASGGGFYSHVVEIIDPRDNRVVLDYDSDHRLERIRYPNGVDEVWDYSPAWAQGNYSGIEVRYYMPGSVAAPELTWGMLFQKTGLTHSRPFRGDRLWRLYYPKTNAIGDSGLTGDPYASLVETPSHVCLEFGHVVLDAQNGIEEVASITHYRASSITDQPLTGGQPKLLVTHAHEVGRWRVKTMAPGQFPTEVTTFGYNGDPQTGLLTSRWVMDPRGTHTTVSIDGQGRPLEVIVTPEDDAVGMPRKHDQTNAGLTYAVVEPAYQKLNFEYDGCSSCGKPSKVTHTSPAGATKEIKYEYWPENGLLKSVTMPNPSNLPGQPPTVMFQYTYTQGPIPTGSWSAWYPASVTGPDGTWTIVVDPSDWIPRVSPAATEAPSYGLKPRTIKRRTPQVTLSEGAPVILEERATFDVTAPPMPGGRQTRLVGQVTNSTDLDGVETSFTYDGQGFLLEIVENPNGLPAEKVTTSMTIDAWGRIDAMVSNAGTALAATYDFTTTVWGHPVAASATVGGVNHEEELLLDRWGHVAVRLRKNKTSTGGTPNDFGLGGANRSESAREYLRDEYHWRGHRLQYSLLDRRELDRDESGAASSAVGARFLETVYLWAPGELLTDVLNPNGGATRLVWDGYGTLYKVEDYFSGQPGVLRQKRFVDGFLQVTEVFQGDVQRQLWTRVSRNGAGAVTGVTEPVGTSPGSWYGGSLGGAVHEFDLDALGRVVTVRSKSGSTVLAKTEVVFDQLGRDRLSTHHILGAGSGTRTIATLWEGLSKLKKSTDDVGRYQQRTFDALGRLKSVQNNLSPLADEVLYGYRANTHLVEKVERKVVEEDGVRAHVTYKTEYDHDKLGRVLQIREFGTGTAPLLHDFTYYTAGATESYTDPSGKLQQYLPDARGRLAEHFLPGSLPIWNGTVYHDHLGTDGRSQLVQIDGRGRITRTNYDYARRPFSILEPGAVAEPTPQSLHQPFARLMAYDSASRVTDVYAGDQVHVRLFYDGPGRLIGRETPSAGINGYVSWYHGRDVYNRDAIGRVLVSGSFYGPAAPTMGMIVEETFLHDSLGRKHRESFRYGGAGANWIDIVSSYSGTDWFRSGLAYQNNLGGGAHDLTMSMVPDAIGRLGELKWQTTAGGAMNLLAKYWHQGAAISRRDTYHAVGSPWKADYVYDTYGRMSRIEHRVGAQTPFSTFDFEYDDASNLVKEWYPKQGGGIGDRFSYDEHHRLLKGWLGADTAKMNAADPEAPQSGTFIKKLTYNLDAANNRDSVLSELGSGGSTPEDYTTQDGAPQGPSNRYLTVNGVALAHDQRGNTIFDGNYWYVYDDLDRLTEVWGVQDTDQTSLTNGSSLAATVPTSPRYSLNNRAAMVAARSAVLGRLPGGPSDVLRRSLQLLSSLAERLPRQTVSRQGTSQSSASSGEEEWMVLRALYLYDGGERRVVRSVVPLAKTWFYAYDGWEEVQEMVLAAQTVPEKQFVWGEQLDELVAYRWKPSGSWSSYYVAEGGAHCPVRVLDSSGTPREVQEYDPYGQTTFYPAGGGAYADSLYGNPFRWKGHRVDPETGLVFMRHRHYSPRVGRFLSTDPIGVWGDTNSLGNGYEYAGGSPVSHSDRLGLQIDPSIGSSTVPFSLRVDGTYWSSISPPGSSDRRPMQLPASIDTTGWGLGGEVSLPNALLDDAYNGPCGIAPPEVSGWSGWLNSIAYSAASTLGPLAEAFKAAAGNHPVGRGAAALARGNYSEAGAILGEEAAWVVGAAAAAALIARAVQIVKGVSAASDEAAEAITRSASLSDEGVDAARGEAKIRNAHLAGKTHPRTGIPFDQQGYPDFSSVTRAQVRITQTGSRAGDFKAANEAAGFSRTPEGFTWHHHQDRTTMQLVPRDIHAQTGHTGGFYPGGN